MLSSNQTSAIERQRQPRRQQSAPLEHEGHLVHSSPTAYLQSGPGPELPIVPPPMEQLPQYAMGEGYRVGITNTGLQQQHYLQVAQQHCQARPGQQQQQEHLQQYQLSPQQYREMQHRKLDAEIDTLIHVNNYAPVPPSTQHFVKMERTRSNPEGYQNIPGVQMGTEHLLMSPSHNGLPVLMEHGVEHVQRRPSHPHAIVTHGWAPVQQQNWSPQMLRPLTPPNQNSSDYFPQTPAQTPYRSYGRLRQQTSQPELRSIRRAHQKLLPVTMFPNGIQEESGSELGEVDFDATIRPNKRRLSGTSIMEGGQMELYPNALPSPPQTAQMKSTRKFDIAMIGGASLDEIPKLTYGPVDNNSVRSCHSSSAASPHMSSIQESPALTQIRPASEIGLAIRSSPVHRKMSPFSEETELTWDLPVRPPMSPRTMSMTDLGLDATIEDTGITAEEVQAYISEPDPNTGKWTCLYPECDKPAFGRKENIRSHIQTHLGDRQFRCNHCSKRFVRQHDLKRHAKIHSGVKPFPCRCGNSFARHDALTRHRQRGICDGGFSGVVKKIAKRGRPRKERLNSEERAEKAARSKKRGDTAYASSEDGTSDSSFPESPERMSEDPEQDPTIAGALSEALLGFPPSTFTWTPPMSPPHMSPPLMSSRPMSPYSTGNAQSPLKATSEKAPSPSTIAVDDHDTDGTNHIPDMILEDIIESTELASHVGSPPGLSHSSPPNSSQLHHLDLFNSSETGPSMNEPDFDMLAEQFTQNDHGHFEESWNPSTYIDFEKDNEELSMSGFGRAFGDENLY